VTAAESLPWSSRSLRLGTRDALKFFHRAWIEDCLGHHMRGRVAHGVEWIAGMRVKQLLCRGALGRLERQLFFVLCGLFCDFLSHQKNLPSVDPLDRDERLTLPRFHPRSPLGALSLPR